MATRDLTASRESAQRPIVQPGARRRSVSAAAFVASCLALACALAACAGGGTSASSGPTIVRSSTIEGLGRVLVDGAGYTLYIYVPDRDGPSTCFGLCARQWPPLLLAKGQHRAKAGAGVRSSLLGTAARPGGAEQVTYHGWPLYTYVDDSSPGEATGQAEDMGAWYAMTAKGAVDHNEVAPGGS